MAKRKVNSSLHGHLNGLEFQTAAVEISYFGDKPNAQLREFVTAHGEPYSQDEDNYSLRAFSEEITIGKRKSASMDLHVYWSKKHHDAIGQYIKHFTKEGNVVLDPFCGSGGTALTALLAGRNAIAVDRSPAATFITKNYCTPVDAKALVEEFDQVSRKTMDVIRWLYETRCDRCGGRATTGYTVYSQVFKCPRCLASVPLFDCVQRDAHTVAGKPTKVNACPHCDAKGHTEVIRSQAQKFGSVPVVVSYICEEGCKPSRSERSHNDQDSRKREFFEKYDLGKINEIESVKIPYWYPSGYDMSGFSRYQRDALYYYGVREVADLYTKRNLWALAALRSACKESPQADFLLFVLNTATLTVSRMCRHDYPSTMPGAYYLPQVNRELNVWDNFEGRVPRKLSGICSIAERFVPGTSVAISTQSATNLASIPASSVDYVFTDPPYADTIQYAELNYVWEAWLGFDTSWHNEEIIVNSARSKSETDWAAMMRLAMAECYRVLKPGRWISLCYHDTSEGTWELIQDIMAEIGFVVDKTDSALFIDTGQKSFNQLNADKTTKRDLVINFRKPSLGEWIVIQTVDGRTFADLGTQVIKDFLTTHPGATKDRIYDALVSRMVQAGKMEAHDFNALLRGVAEEVQEPIRENLFDNKAPDLFGSHVSSRWYLKETADEVDTAEQEKEDAAAARLEKYMVTHLRKHPEDEGVHYSDLFEQYLPVGDKPRRLLADWLPEYFFKTAAGTWRPPTDEKEQEQKAALRQTGTLRRIKRFANALIDGVPVRDKDRPGNDHTLADWVRQCRRAGLFEQGRALYEKGGLNLDHLNETEQIEVEDDYRICVRRGAAAEAKTRRPRRKTGEQ